MPMQSKTRAPLTLLIGLGLFVPLTACDKVEQTISDQAEDKTEDKKAEADAKEGGGEDEDEGDDKEVDPKEAEIAALKAELEAAKEAQEAAKEIDPEAAEQLDEPIEPEDEVGEEEKLEEGEKGPVSLANVQFTDKKVFGAQGVMFELTSDVTVNEDKEGGVYAKASCVVGDEVYVNVATVSTKHTDLGKMSVGDTKPLTTRLFYQGLPEKPSRCQLAYDYGAPTFSTRLADYCWTGSEIKDGACEEEVKAEPKGDGKIVPFGFAVDIRKSMDPDRPDDAALDVTYGARINESVDKAPHLYLKTACKVGDKTWVQVSPDLPHVKPFKFQDGEAVRIRHNQFFLNALPGSPEACNMQVIQDGGYQQPDTELGQFCFEGSSVADGACEFYTKDPVDAAEMGPESMVIDELAIEWGNDWKDKEKVVLNMRIAATVATPISNRVHMTGMATCDGTDDKEHHIGPDLELIGAGETVGIRMVAFRDSPLAKPSGKCEITFAAAEFGADEKIEIAKLCLKGDQMAPAKKGKCRGKGKAVDVGTEVVFVASEVEEEDDSGNKGGGSKGGGSKGGGDVPKPEPDPGKKGKKGKKGKRGKRGKKGKKGKK